LKIILDNFNRKIGILDEYVIVWRRDFNHPYLIREPEKHVIGEVILNIPRDIITILDHYEYAGKKTVRIEERVRLVNSDYVDAYVYIWKNDDIHDKKEEFQTLIPEYLI